MLHDHFLCPFCQMFPFLKKKHSLVLFCFFMKNNTYHSAATTALYATAARTKSQKFFPVIIFKGNFKLVENIILGIFTRLAVNKSSFDIRVLNKLLIKLEFPFAHLFLALLTMETKLTRLEILHR